MGIPTTLKIVEISTSTLQKKKKRATPCTLSLIKLFYGVKLEGCFILVAIFGNEANDGPKWKDEQTKWDRAVLACDDNIFDMIVIELF